MKKEKWGNYDFFFSGCWGRDLGHNCFLLVKSKIFGIDWQGAGYAEMGRVVIL